MKEDEEKLNQSAQEFWDSLSPKSQEALTRLYNLAYETGRRIARRRAYLAKNPRHSPPETDTQENEKNNPE